MLYTALTNQVCAQIIDLLLRKRKWTIARIAKVIGASVDYVRRIQNREQSFQIADVELLAKACRCEPFRLIFDSFQRDQLTPDMRGLYDLTQKEIASHDEFERVLLRKPSKKRRSRTKAA